MSQRPSFPPDPSSGGFPSETGSSGRPEEPSGYSPLDGLRPERVWQAFDGIRRIPRPPRSPGRIVRHVRSWAERHGFEVRSDDYGNLSVRVPAKAGFEASPGVVLQAHLDMVCEQNEGTGHDFERDPIQVEVEGDRVRARGTTLGADNGLGVALAMAAATDPEAEHGPLELLLTLDEEIGLQGARALDGSLVGARLLVNLDAEEDDAIYIGCAGSAGVSATLELERVPVPAGARPYLLRVRGLEGGHSGIDIHRNRGNAVALLARILAHALDAEEASGTRGFPPTGADTGGADTGGADTPGLGLAALDGGGKANALAREATACLWLGQVELARLRASLELLRPRIEDQLRATDPESEIRLEPLPEAPRAELRRRFEAGPVKAAVARRWVRLLDALPHGVLAMSADMPELVETSANLAAVATGGEGVAESSADTARVLVSLRSSSTPSLDAAGQSVASACRLAGARVERIEGYPGWLPNPSSPLVARTAACYRRLFGEDPELRAVHAGVECGVVAQKAPGLDAVSLGPLILGAHSPDERVSISSVAKIYRWLSALLRDLADSETESSAE